MPRREMIMHARPRAAHSENVPNRCRNSLTRALLTKNALTTVLANSMHFHGLPLRCETEGTRLGFDQFGHAGIAYFLGAVTDVTDQERHLMLFGRMVAGDVGVDRLELMDEAVLEQEIERN